MSNKREKTFYKAEDLAEILDVNIMTIYRHINDYKTLKAFKIGKEFRIEKEEFEKFLKNNKFNKK